MSKKKKIQALTDLVNVVSTMDIKLKPEAFDRPFPAGQETGPSRPFQPGDVVQLKSGGLNMTVRCLECLDQVELVWSGYGDLNKENLPAACLKLVDPAELDAEEKRTLKDNIPF